MNPDIRLYWDPSINAHRLTCVSCGTNLFESSHALTRRLIIDVADLTLGHDCGGVS